MRVKRFLVDSMPDALTKIRSELGHDAVILNTKEIRLGGFLGLFSKKKIEVIAATEQRDRAQSTASVARPIEDTYFPTAANREDEAVQRFQQAATVRQARGVTMQAEVKSNANDHTLDRTAEIRQFPSNKEDLLLAEMKQMKEMMLKLNFERHHVHRSVPKPFARIYQRLVEQEVKPALVELLIERSLEAYDGEVDQLSFQQARQFMKDQLKQLLLSRTSEMNLSIVQAVCFVGPTGVGKTTTIAKLAAEQALKFNRKVGFITADTYRISAVEQLKTYAAILNGPLEVVFSPQDTVKAFHKLADRDIIFMDTAGRNYRTDMQISELNSYLQTNRDRITFLVLSLTTRYKDIKVLLDKFANFPVDYVLFTKLDETDSYGSIFNLCHEYTLPLSYLTNGQNVPDDIRPINEDELLELILGDVDDG